MTCPELVYLKLAPTQNNIQCCARQRFEVCSQGYSALKLYEASALPEDPVGRKIAAHSVTAGPGVKVVQVPTAQ